MRTTAIIVPCYNEAGRLDVSAFRAFIAAHTDVGFVFVNDGSRDDTLAVLGGIARGLEDRCHVVDQQPNAGKAAAVWRGLRLALDGGTPTIVGYWDADLATPLADILTMRRCLDEQPELDVVLGSRVRLLGRQIDRSPPRHYAGRVFATFASLLLHLPVYDTQCGAKLFRVNAALRDALEEPFTSGWIFDVELLRRLVITRRAHGLAPVEEATLELPLRRWRDVGGSKVRAADFPRALRDLARLRARYGRRGFE